MGLIELCLLSLLSPQEPAGAQSPVHTPAKPAPTASESVEKPDQGQDPRSRLQALEAENKTDAAELLDLTAVADEAVAARAAWLLATAQDPVCKARLPEVLTRSPHAAARRQALQKMRVIGDPNWAPHALTALEDEDRDVRTLAVLLLGKLRRPALAEPLLTFVHAHANDQGEAVDVVAAILALADFGSPEHLLRLATVIGDGTVQGTGQALAFAFQTLSPKLAHDNELTTLVAVLGHREPLLRRYAIERLTELGDTRAIRALEGRLATEGDELRSQIELAIAQLRGDDPQPLNEVERATANARILWARCQNWWHSLDPLRQAAIGATPVLVFALLWLGLRLARRRQRAADAQALAALVQPSDEYLEDQEYTEDEDYYDDCEEGGDYEQDGEALPEEDLAEEFAEVEDVADADDGVEYDTSGWEDDEAELHEGAVVDDERFN